MRRSFLLPYGLAVVALSLAIALLSHEICPTLISENGPIEMIGLVSWAALGIFILLIPHTRVLWPWALICFALAEREFDGNLPVPEFLIGLLIFVALVSSLARLIQFDGPNLYRIWRRGQSTSLTLLLLAGIGMALGQVLDEFGGGVCSQLILSFEEVLETSGPVLLLILLFLSWRKRSLGRFEGLWTRFP